MSPDNTVPPGPPDGAVAAVDCGTNSTRLLVVDRTGVSLVRRMEITRLGQGVDASGHLSVEAVERTTDVLSSYRVLMDEAGVVRARLVATSAARDAKNSGAALRAIREASGIEPEILPGAEEGRLSFLGATAELDRPAGTRVVADIGGGSTELAFASSGGAGRGDARSAEDSGTIEVCSLDVGCVRVTERYLEDDPPTARQMREARSGVTAAVEEALVARPALLEVTEMIGLAGTVSALAQMRAGAREYDRSVVHHARLDRRHVRHALSELSVEDVATRSRRPAMDPGRADVIVGGTLVLDVLMEVLGQSSCLVSEADILDGLVLGQLGGGPTMRR